MKVLVIYCTEFSYHPAVKTLPDASEVVNGTSYNDCLDLNINAPGFSLARIWADL